eukprot:Skav204210  [mRNA]  locus=scaffold985:402021:407224:- [translate_table: standard]
MAAAPRKRKRVTPTLLAPADSDTGPSPAVPAAVAPPDAQQGAPELEVVAKAVEQLQPLKVVMNSKYLAALLRDARILVFDEKALLCETSIAHLCKPKELLSLQLRESDPVIAATNGRVFFFCRVVGEWFSFNVTTSMEEELLLALQLGKGFEAKFVSFAGSSQADPQHFRQWPDSTDGDVLGTAGGSLVASDFAGAISEQGRGTDVTGPQRTTGVELLQGTALAVAEQLW